MQTRLPLVISCVVILFVTGVSSPAAPATVTKVAAGDYHCFFLKSDRSLWGMGGNYDGQLGDGTTTERATPIRILSNGATLMEGGGQHSLVVKSDGSLWGMGYDIDGELGTGTVTYHVPRWQETFEKDASMIRQAVPGELLIRTSWAKDPGEKVRRSRASQVSLVGAQNGRFTLTSGMLTERQESTLA